MRCRLSALRSSIFFFKTDSKTSVEASAKRCDSPKTQIHTIRNLVRQTAGETARVRLFGSRLDDGAQGGDVDLMLELLEPVDNPALLAAQLSARISRAMSGRKVDVLISAPNLMRLPIHEIALQEGVLL